ncbi:MAG: hypothetical protein ACOCX7_03890, partial [Bacteroidota bacterium]
FDKELPSGRYTAEITHQLAGRTETKTVPVEVFPTKLTDESTQKIGFRLGAFAFYGYSMIVDPVPSSGGKIKSNQFRIYLRTDQQEQRPPVEGLSVSQDEALKLDPNADKVGVRVSWVQPYTGKEVDLYPMKWFDIKQESPGIIVRRMATEVTGTAQKLKIRVAGLQVTQPGTGGDQNATVKVNVGEAQKLEGLQSYDFSIEPSIDGDPESGYNIYMEMDGSLQRGQDRVTGTIQVPVKAFAVNPVNGKSSEEITENITIQVNYEPERGGRRRRR